MTISTALRSNCHPEIVKKDLIVLHFTAGGTAAGAINWWNLENRRREATAVKWRVGTSYVIDRDATATVYEAFPPECWAYGLGIGDADVEKRCVQIEIANYGPLRLDQDGRYYPKDHPGKNIFVPANQVVRRKFRDEDYFHAFTDAQMRTAIDLVRATCERFSIPRVIPPQDKIGVYSLDWARRFRGVVDHSNFRRDGKWDIGPAFDWTRFAAGISA